MKQYCEGLLAAALQVILVYPFDILRVKYFVQEGTADLQLYNGLAFSLIASIIKLSLIYPNQHFLTEHLFREYPLFGNAILGILLGLMTTPINIIKIPIQLDGNKSVWKVMQDIWKLHGIKGFFHGGLATIGRDFSWTISYFQIFQQLQQRQFDNLLIIVIASLIATTISYPFDCVRLYQQIYFNQSHSIDGLKQSLSLTRSNLQGFLVSNARVTVATLIGHGTYLWLSSSIK